MAIIISRTRTSKGYSPKSQWMQVDKDRKRFADMAEAREWLKSEYGSSKRRAMYRDTREGATIRCGYVIGFRDSDGRDKWLQQDWIEFQECTTINLDKLHA